MTVTTIKVDSSVRDVLKAQAAERGRTLGEHLSALAESEAQALRFLRLREAMRVTPPDEAYRREAEEWGSDAWS